MKNFEIEFSAHEVNYKAKGEQNSFESIIYPLNTRCSTFNLKYPKRPKPLCLYINHQKKKFECTIFNGDVELSTNILVP